MLDGDVEMRNGLRKNLEGQHRGAASLLAVALLVGSGVGYRVLASRITDLFAIAPLEPGALAQLPARIGEWLGHDKPLDEWTLDWIHADDHVSRVYTRGATDTVSMLIALRRRDVAYGVPATALMPHRPENCYPRVGWTPDGAYTVELEAADGASLPVKILHFRRGELEVERVVVVCYYIVDERTGPSVEMLRPNNWRPKGDVRYVAQIQITCNKGLLGASAEEQVRAFAVDSAPAIRSLITRAVKWEDASDAKSAG